MASPVDTSVKFFRSTMFAAPVLNGTAGAHISVLTACLVTGFDTKTATSLVVASGVAALSFSGSHSAMVDSVVLVEGSSIAALNGEQKVTSLAAGVVRFATAEADATATGTITFKMAPAGWTSPFTGTNLATYKSADVASTGMILRVDDTGTTRSRVVGYEQMTGVSTGTAPFPTAVQMSGGGYWPKSTVASAATAIPWVLVADGRKFFIHVSPGFASSPTFAGGVAHSFGDELVLRPGGDAYACALTYSVSPTATNTDGSPDGVPILQTAMPRAYSGLGSSFLHSTRSYTGGSVVSGIDTTLGNFPPLDGGLRVCAKFISEATSSSPPRCNVAGLYHVPQALVWDSIKLGDVTSGTGQLVGRKMLAFTPSTATNTSASSGIGVSLVDITGPWR